jgi:hypothetical protein
MTLDVQLHGQEYSVMKHTKVDGGKSKQYCSSLLKIDGSIVAKSKRGTRGKKRGWINPLEFGRHLLSTNVSTM